MEFTCINVKLSFVTEDSCLVMIQVHCWFNFYPSYICPYMDICPCPYMGIYVSVHVHIFLCRFLHVDPHPYCAQLLTLFGEVANANAGGEIIGFASAQRLRLNFYHSFEFQNQTETLDICNIIIGKSSHFLWWPLVTSLSALWGKFQINIGFFTF